VTTRLAPGLLAAVLLACAAAPPSPLLQAASRGDLEVVRVLLDQQVDVGQVDRSGATPLHLATNRGAAPVVALLLERGAAVDAREFDGDTPLHNAAALGREQIAVLLLRAGADPRAISSQGLTPAQHAHRAGHGDLGAALSQAIRDVQELPPIVDPTRHPSWSGDTRGSVRRDRYRPGYRRRVAAVVGIDAYVHWPPLSGAADARRVAERLRGLGFDEVLELYDADVTRQGLLDLLGRRLPETVREEDLVVVFFAGHGDTESLPNGERRGYVIPVDARADRSFSTAVSMDELRELAARVPAKHVYYVMDACYSGLLFTRGAVLVPRKPGYVDKITSRPAVQMLVAGREDELAIERNGEGVFTSHFLRAIGGEADLDGDGWVTASEINVFVVPRVTQDSKGDQTPRAGVLEGDGEVVFSARPQ